MGELCLRWAVRLPARVPLTRYGGPLTKAGARALYLHWTRIGVIPVTLGLRQVGDLLMEMDDVLDLPRISPSLVVAWSGLPPSTVRTVLQRFETVGRRILAGQGPP
jgi:hypothetical protein